MKNIIPLDLFINFPAQNTTNDPNLSSKCIDIASALSSARLFVITVFLLCFSQAGVAQMSWGEEYAKRIRAAEAVSPLSDQVLGDNISLFNGGLTFSATDVSVPGNNSLSVAFPRRVDPTIPMDGNLPGMPAWFLDLPHLSGIYAATDSAAGYWTPAARCSGSALPDGTSGFSPSQFWSGSRLSLPGGGGGDLLQLDGNPKLQIPQTGQTFTRVTKDRWFFSCLPSLQSGQPGEGFVGLAPDGSKYYFDWLTTTSYPGIQDRYGVNMYPLNRVRVRIYPTKIEDRFGNAVHYTWSGSKLIRIHSQNEIGREINISYTTTTTTITADGKQWLYSGSRVTNPDNTQWIYASTVPGFIQFSEEKETGNFGQLGQNYKMDRSNPCQVMRLLLPNIYTVTLTSPSGITGTYSMTAIRHRRTNVPLECEGDEAGGMDSRFNIVPLKSDSHSLIKKQVSGIGIATQTWSYAFDITGTTTTRPDSSIVKYTFGKAYQLNEGQLLKQETKNAAGSILSTVDNSYVTETEADNVAFPSYAGIDPRIFLSFGQDNWSSAGIRPVKTTTIIQDGVTFSNVVNNFDSFVSPTSVTKSSSLGDSRTDTTAYEHNLSKWVLGQVKTVTNTNTTPNVVLSSTDYDAVTALPLRNYSFGQTQPDTSFTYLSDGNVSTIKDALDRTVTLGDYYRGVPRLITFSDATTMAATVNSTGTIASVTDQLGTLTQYGYDTMNRLASITPPAGDTVAWAGTTQTFSINTVAAYGLPAGHWKQTISKGNYRKEIYFNAMWQPVVTREYDNSNIASTQRFTRMAYDVTGRTIFSSYPGTTDALTLGVRTQYDALGRVTKTIQDSELGALNTVTEYLSGFQTRVTNPRGFATTTSYQVFDSPDTSRPEIILSPGGISTTILRDHFGKTLEVTRSGTYGGSPISSTRKYVYDSDQRLCKRIEPETGATIMDYDAVDNLLWSVQGSALTSTVSCDRASVAAADKTVRTYNSLNRLLTTDVPGSTNDLTYDYFADGALKTLMNGGNRWDYTYNKLRLPETETLTIDGRVKTLTHSYNTLAQESSLTYPSGLVVATTPNALGQASQAGSYASAITYFANGGMSGFNYGNGIVHSMTQNVRQLPARSRDMNAAIAVLDDTYVFDANGNVASITDSTAGAGGNRVMTYDNADRLIRTNAPNQWWINNYITYDALDNIRVNTLGSRTHNYQYNATTQRLDQLTLPNALVARNLAYDASGNVTNNGAQSYVFDKANRMQSVNGLENYQYDGHGRRVKITRVSDNKISYPIYSLEGKIVADEDQRSNKTNDYIYLNGSLVAKRSAPIGTSTYTTSYQHTDSLGSPVAESDAAKTVTRIERYTSYGEASDGSAEQGPGYTGHVMDAATGLTYMQQRYYDPVIGRFLSADPDPSDIDTGWNFNRYNYAGNNPYKFTDPDGRKYALPNASKEFKKEFKAASKYLKKSEEGKQLFKELKKSSVTVNIVEAPSGSNDMYYDPAQKEIVWDPKSGLQVGTINDVQSPALGLLHEVDHAVGDIKGTAASTANIPGDPYHTAEEKRVIQSSETNAATKLGEPTRANHGGTPVQVGCSTCKK